MGSRTQEGTWSHQGIAAHDYMVDSLLIVVSFQHSSPEGLWLQPVPCVVDWNDLEYLPTKTEKVKYLQNMKTHTYCLFRPIKQHHSRFKQAQDHKKWWRID